MRESAYRLITIDKGTRIATVWATFDNVPQFKQLMQYFIDSYNNVESFLVEDMETKKLYNAYRTATEGYGMRQRTFEERMKDIVTGN